MKFLIIMMIVALSLPVLASRKLTRLNEQLAGKEVLRQLIRQTPWDRARLAHILTLEMLEDTTAADYVPQAERILEQLIKTELRQEKLAQLLLWKVTTPRGKQHWLLGTDHEIKLGFFSTAARQQLDALVAEIDVHMHEGMALADTSLPIEVYPTLDTQLIVMAQRRGKKVVPLENWREESISTASLLSEQVNEFANQRQWGTFSAAETEACCLEEVGAQEALFRETLAYLRGDHATLLELYSDWQFPVSDNIKKYLLDVRNRNWMQKITAACRSRETCLVVAGYAHFIHDSEAAASIITMLRKLDYGIELAQP